VTQGIAGENHPNYEIRVLSRSGAELGVTNVVKPDYAYSIIIDLPIQIYVSNYYQLQDAAAFEVEPLACYPLGSR
jgi:hypothetical protein